jgi:N-hydroxyarylamine O-acetyltransferase
MLSQDCLDRYLTRVGHGAPLQPGARLLASLHRAHVESIPFENLCPRFGKAVSLQLPELVAKLVDGRRGGYCFEHNGLFAAVLESLGFSVVRLAARVLGSASGILPRTHALLLVTGPDGTWLADTGFGGRGLLQPLPFSSGAEVQVGPWRHRLRQDGDLWTLACLQPDGWQDLYTFDLQPQLEVDMELANWYTSTHPDSLFRRMLLVQRVTAEYRLTLRDRELAEDRGVGPRTRTLDPGELPEVLERVFGLPLPADFDPNSV